jgi:hypothetical protein
MQTFLDTRDDSDQPFIDRLARDFLRPQDVRELEVALGRPMANIHFRPAEFLYLNTIFPTPDSYRRRYIEFYKYVLTLDRWLARVRGLYRIVSEMNDIASDSVYAMLRNELIHPSYIPWRSVSEMDFRAMRPDVQARFSIKHPETKTYDKTTYDDNKDALHQNVPVAWGHFDDVSAGAKNKYLCQFPVIGTLVALVQGLYLDNPAEKVAKWVNASLPLDSAARSWQNGGPFGLYDEDWQQEKKDVANNPNLVWNDARAEWYRDLEENVPGSPSRHLMQSMRRVGGMTRLYTIFNNLMHMFQRMLVRSPLIYERSADFFVTDMISGPNTGENMQCGPGMAPSFIGYNGQPVPPQEALLKINGRFFVSSVVDPLQSGCMPLGEVRWEQNATSA